MQIKKTKSGKYCYVERYYDLEGKQRAVSVTYDSDSARVKKMAQKELTLRLETLKLGHSSYTLQEIKDRYMAYCEKYLKESTIDKNESCCRHAINIIGPNVKYEDLTAGYIKLKLQESGKSPVTLNEYLRRIKAMLNWAFQNDLIPDKTVRDKLSMFVEDNDPDEEEDEDEKVEKYLEFDQVQTLLNHLKVERWKLALQFLFLTGLRIGEFIALEKSDVDLENRSIYITKNYNHRHKHTTSTKTKASRASIYIQDELLPVIKEINAFMIQDQLVSGYRTKLFMAGEDGKPVNYFTINAYYKENSLACLGQAFTMHSTRHTHASLLFAQGVDLQTVKRRLRHKNSRVTEEIYIHVTKKLKEKDQKQFDSINLIS